MQSAFTTWVGRVAETPSPAHWRGVLPGMMAQMGIAGGLTEVSPPLYLTGGANVVTPVPDAAFTWLQPQVQSTQAAQKAPRP